MKLLIFTFLIYLASCQHLPTTAQEATGEWASPCFQSTTNFYIKNKLTIDKQGTFKQEMSWFDQATCAPEALSFTIEESGNVQFKKGYYKVKHTSLAVRASKPEGVAVLSRFHSNAFPHLTLNQTTPIDLNQLGTTQAKMRMVRKNSETLALYKLNKGSPVVISKLNNPITRYHKVNIL